MIRFEIALAVIGMIITVMGILIAFEITFPTELFHEEYRAITTQLYKYKEHGRGVIPVDFSTNGKQYTLAELCEMRLKNIRNDKILILIGLAIIILLIVQTFAWQIDPKTNQIRTDYFRLLFLSLTGAFGWIAYLIGRIHGERDKIYKTLLREAKKIEESETKNNKNQK